MQTDKHIIESTVSEAFLKTFIIYVCVCVCVCVCVSVCIVFSFLLFLICLNCGILLPNQGGIFLVLLIDN